jgi:hypothetical protein
MDIARIIARIQVPGSSAVQRLREWGEEDLFMKGRYSRGCHNGCDCAFSKNPLLEAALNPEYDKIIGEALDADARRHDKEIYLSNYQSLVLQRYASDAIKVPQPRLTNRGYEVSRSSETIIAVKKHCKVATVPDYVKQQLVKHPVQPSFWDLRTSLRYGPFGLLQYFPNADSAFAAWISA